MNHNCDYRLTIACKFLHKKRRTEEEYLPCELCLAGQQIESIELLTSAIMEKSIDKLDSGLDEYNRLTGQNIKIVKGEKMHEPN